MKPRGHNLDAQMPPRDGGIANDEIRRLARSEHDLARGQLHLGAKARALDDLQDAACGHGSVTRHQVRRRRAKRCLAKSHDLEDTYGARDLTSMTDSTAHFVPFGRYLLERRLAVGGMAEVFLGRLPGPRAFTKRVVIKRLLQHLVDDQDAVTSFLDEAKLAARFTHPNLIQVFELAQIEGQYCIVMEYLEGADLAQLLDACAARRVRVPAPIAALLVARAAEALEYVHRLTGDDGQPLSIVHADVSPGNIVLTQQGEVKVVDFGVAKHAGARTDVVRGKPGYMPPEQLEGHTIDARADVFALGVVLYELLAGRLFLQTRETNLDLASHTESRLSELRTDDGLAQILRSALRARPDERTSSAADVHRALEGYMATVTRPLASDVAAFAQNVMPERSSTSPLRTVAHEKTRAVRGQYTDPRVPMRPETVALLVRDEDPPKRSYRARVAIAAVTVAVLCVAALVGLTHAHTTVAPPSSASRADERDPQEQIAADSASTPSRAEPSAAEVETVPSPAGPASREPLRATPATEQPPPARRPHTKAQNAKSKAAATAAPTTPPPPAQAPHAAAVTTAAPPSIATAKGRVAFIIEPWAQVYLGERHLGTTPMAPITLQEGHYDFRLVSPDTGHEKTVSVNVTANKTSKVVENLR